MSQFWNGLRFHERGFKKMEFINYRMSSFEVDDVMLNVKRVYSVTDDKVGVRCDFRKE
jgi:hypothetical protein